MLWYSDKVELHSEDRRNKPSPPSMQPHPLVNQQRISQCPHHSHRNWLIRWNSPGSLHWNSAEDARNTDLLRARVSTTQQGNDWLDCECAASWCHLLKELDIINWLKKIKLRNALKMREQIFQPHKPKILLDIWILLSKLKRSWNWNFALQVKILSFG